MDAWYLPGGSAAFKTEGRFPLPRLYRMGFEQPNWQAGDGLPGPHICRRNTQITYPFPVDGIFPILVLKGLQRQFFEIEIGGAEQNR